MILVTGEFRLPIDRCDQARDAMARMIVASRAEPGCIAYCYAEDLLEPGLFRVSEAWTDPAALAAHFESAHMRQWREERAALGMTGRLIERHDVTGSQQL